jgi:exosortase
MKPSSDAIANRLMPFWHLAALCAILAGATVLFLVPYSQGYGFVPVPLWSNLVSIWGAKEFQDWQHGMIVPVISLGLLWMERKKIAAASVKPSNVGIVVVIAALAAYWVGLRAQTHYIGWLSVQLFVAGAITWLLGWAVMRAVFFPWAFLVFAWPLPFLTENIAVPLRHLMAGLSSAFLNLVGIATLKVGTALRSAAQYATDGSVTQPVGALFTLDVADPCSGIRSLFAIIMVSAIFGYLTLPTWWQRIALIVCSIPLVIVGNFFRMLMLTFGTIWFGSEVAIGKGIDNPSLYHQGAGYAVFGVALLGMLAVQKILALAPEKLSGFLRQPSPAASDEPPQQLSPRDSSGDAY